MHIVQIGCHVGNDSVFSLIEHKEEQIKKALNNPLSQMNN